jgi:hypothetical protein
MIEPIMLPDGVAVVGSDGEKYPVLGRYRVGLTPQ